MAADAKTLLKRAERRKSDRATLDSRYEERAQFLAPDQRGFRGELVEGALKTERIYDADPLDAVALATAGLHGSMTPSSAEWMAYQTPEDEVNADDEAAEYLEAATHTTFLNLGQSNFASQITPVYRDGLVFNTAVLAVETRRREGPWFPGFRFTALPLQQTYVDENGEGRVDTADRWLWLTARQAMEKWPGGTFSDEVLKAAEAEPTKKHCFLHTVYPRAGGRADAVAQGKPWASRVVEVAKQSDVWESGFDDFPLMVWRWMRAPNSIYGVGPGEWAMPDVKSLNEAMRMGFEAWAVAIKPPTWLDDQSVIGTVRNGSGGLNWLRPGARQPMPWISGARFDVQQVQAEELRRKIRRTLLAAHLEVPERLPSQPGQPVTATEILVRRELVEQLLGPAVAQIEAELLQPLAERLFALQYREGLFGPVPETLDGVEVSAKFQGPLARVQRMPEVLAIERFEAGLYAEVQATGDASVLDLLDRDAKNRLKARVIGVPAAATRSERQVAEIREARAEEQARQQAITETQEDAEVVSKVAPMVKALQPGQARAA